MNEEVSIGIVAIEGKGHRGYVYCAMVIPVSAAFSIERPDAFQFAQSLFVKRVCPICMGGCSRDCSCSICRTGVIWVQTPQIAKHIAAGLTQNERALGNCVRKDLEFRFFIEKRSLVHMSNSGQPVVHQ